MYRILISHILPIDCIKKYGLSFASCNFCWNLIEGGVFDEVYSILPSSVVGQHVERSMRGLVYSPWRDGNSFQRRIAPIVEQLRLFRKIPKRSSVWFYNLTVLSVVLYVLLWLFKPSVKRHIIMLDYDSRYRWDRLFLPLINKADGMIKVSNSSRFHVGNEACLAGVVPATAAQHPMIEEVKHEFLVCGVVNENISMISMLIEAFAKMPEMKLHITGFYSDEVRKACASVPNIYCQGTLPYEDYQQLLDEIPFLLSTRNPASPENECNFPSKIIEALLHNRIVISTLHYEQLQGIRYFEVPTEADAFVCSIRTIVQSPELLNYANQSDLVKQAFSTSVWAQTMSKIESKKQS